MIIRLRTYLVFPSLLATFMTAVVLAFILQAKRRFHINLFISKTVGLVMAFSALAVFLVFRKHFGDRFKD